MRVFVAVIFFYATLFASEYWSIDEYTHLFAEQKELMQEFEKIVQAQAVALKNQDKKIKITIIYPDEKSNDYWHRSQKSFEKRLQQLQIAYSITAHFVDENDVDKIKQQMIDLLHDGTDYLIFTINADAHKKLIAQLIHQKEPKVILQNITTPLKQWGDNQPFFYVGFDHIEGTKLLADYLMQKYPKGSKFLMLYHNQGYVSKMRGDSFIQMTKGYFDLQKAYYTDAKDKKAYDKVLNYTNLDDVDFIYNCSTEIAIGASKALKQRALNQDIALNGWGGGSVELAMIKKGELNFTVMRMNDDNGVAMAEAIKMDLQGREVPLIYSGSFQIVDTNTSKQKIERLKKRAFRYSQ